MNRLLSGSVSILAVLAATSVHAQDGAGAAQAAPQAAQGEMGLEDIIVTAQRRSENLQNAGLAITAVGADTLVRARVTDTTQLTQVAPALQVGTVAGSANTFYLRGVGNFTTNSLSDSAVSFNVDGIPFARSQAAHGVFYDLERVEVLKGPQGILYGKNSTGGAINVISAKPRMGELGGYAQGEFGNFNAYNMTAAINLPVSEKSALRVAGQISGHDGYYSDGTGDDNLRAVRAQYAADLTETFHLLIGADYAYQGGVGGGATVIGLDRSKRIGLFDPRADAKYTSTYAFLAGNFLQALPNATFPPYNNNEFWGVYAQADLETSLGTLTVIPAYRKTRLDQRSYGPGFDYFVKMKSNQSSLEVRLASKKGSPVDYILGGFYMNEKTDENPIYNQQYFVGAAYFGSRTDSAAVFGQLTGNLSDRFRVLAGARYTSDRKKGLIDSYNLGVVCFASFTGGSCPGTPALQENQVPQIGLTPTGQVIPIQPYGPGGAVLQTTRIQITPQRTFKKTTFRAGMEYDAAPHSLLYATVETGFKAGGFFSTIDNPVFEPETITSFTVGSKNSFANNRVRLNLEGFYWIYKNQQVSHLSADSQGGIQFATENAGKTRIWGFEVEGQVQAATNTRLYATVQYLNAKYADFVYRTPAATGTPTTGCKVVNPSGASFVVDCSGSRPPNSPEWTLAGGIEQSVPTASGEFVFNADARYQSSIYTGFEELPSQYQNGYATVNAQLRYEFTNPKVTIAAFVNNLFDINAAGFSLPNPRAGAALVVESLRPPRTFGARLRYEF